MNKSQILIRVLQEYDVKNALNVQSILKDLFVYTIQEMLEAELDNHLGYSRYDYQNKKTNDIRTGYQIKKT